ncbi:hypothetical protein SCALM49S_10192 [Streptomyces californicus]
MRSRLLPLLIVLMAAVLLTLGLPLAVSVAAAEQQRLVIDRIDDTARFAGLAQAITDTSPDSEERRRTLQTDLEVYASVYGIRAGVFFRDDRALAKAPGSWSLPAEGEGRTAFAEALLGRRSHDPPQVWPWRDGRVVVASPVVRDGDVVAVVVIDSPTGEMRGSRILRNWLYIALGEALALLVAVGAAVRLTGWVLLPVRTLDAATHDIAGGRMRSRVAASAGPPELRRLARSFNEMADNVEDVLEQQRAFVADASHQLRNPLAALLLRIELLALELPEGREEIAAVRTEGKRLARVLDDLLDLALAEHAEADLQLIDIVPLTAERVGGHHGRPVEPGGAGRRLQLRDQFGLHRDQPDLEAPRQLLHGRRGQAARPEEGVEPAVGQPDRHGVDAHRHRSDVAGRVEPRRRQQPVRHQPDPGALLPDADPLAPQVGHRTDVGVAGDDELHVVVVQPDAAAQPLGPGPPVAQVRGHGVGGGDGEVRLAGRHPGQVLLRALTGPQLYGHLRHVLGERALQPFPVPLVDPAGHPGGEGEGTVRRALVPGGPQPPGEQPEHDREDGARPQGTAAVESGQSAEHARDPASSPAP